MLDHNQLDEVSSVNFETATLRISNKEDNGKFFHFFMSNNK